MLTHLIERRLRRDERLLGAGTLDYVRHLWRTSRPAFWAFASAGRFLDFRRRLPRAAYHAARITATRGDDCGTCVQMMVRVARADGIGVDVLRPLVQGDLEALPAPLARVARYAAAVIAADDAQVAELLPALEADHGPDGVAELALAIAGARVYPTTKRALGQATSCSLVAIDVA